MPEWPPEHLAESLADRRIREAMERGDFDDLPGSGKPLPTLEEPYEPNWWIKRWLQREGVDVTELSEAGLLDRWRAMMRRQAGR